MTFQYSGIIDPTVYVIFSKVFFFLVCLIFGDLENKYNRAKQFLAVFVKLIYWKKPSFMMPVTQL